MSEPPLVVTSIAPFACYCDGDRFNCTNFNSQRDAQVCFDVCVEQGAGDVHHVDDDHDGIACESLPPNFKVLDFGQ